MTTKNSEPPTTSPDTKKPTTETTTEAMKMREFYAALPRNIRDSLVYRPKPEARRFQSKLP